MGQSSQQDAVTLARLLLDTLPRVMRRLRADIPLENESVGADWKEITELRATPGQLSLLYILTEHERCTMQELAEHLAVVPSTVTPMVKRLLAEGYIERSRDEVDWRTVWVTITEKGRQVINRIQDVRLSTLQLRLAQLSEEEKKNLCAALPALQHLIEVQL